ncbi:RNA 3'-terminal phosphate cyclase [Micromonospora wenchangensis]|uniref:RNA 3'-terminal phosphate cyclase n=1 Tax=Micromonospora wenchangensis TaxID=1185415 RepID=UPI003D708C3E
MPELTVVDCSVGEGGGGALRAALPMAVLTGRPVRLTNIRANRSGRSAGVGWTHRTYIEALRGWTSSEAEYTMGGTELTFYPGHVPDSEILIDLDDPVGTFGANTVSGRRNYLEASDRFMENVDNVDGKGLMGNAVSVFFVGLLPLLYAAPPSASVEVSGGTETLGAPFVDVVRDSLFPAANELTGKRLSISVQRRGCIGRGGGFATAAHDQGQAGPVSRLRRNRDTSQTVTARFYIFGGRQWRATAAGKVVDFTARLSSHLSRTVSAEVEMVPYPVNRAQVLFLVGSGIYSRDISFCSEEVGREAFDVEGVLDRLSPELDLIGFTSRFIAEQLLPLLCTKPGPSMIKTEKITPHLFTVAALARSITGRKIDLTESTLGATVVVR